MPRQISQVNAAGALNVLAGVRGFPVARRWPSLRITGLPINHWRFRPPLWGPEDTNSGSELNLMADIVRPVLRLPACREAYQDLIVLCGVSSDTVRLQVWDRVLIRA